MNVERPAAFIYFWLTRTNSELTKRIADMGCYAYLYMAYNVCVHINLRLWTRMAIHVQDEEADWLVREFARRRGLGITAAIKVAIQEASSRERSAGELLGLKIEPLLKQVRANRGASFYEKDKAFMDEMWEEKS